MSGKETTLIAMNNLIQSKLDEIIQSHSVDGKINISGLQKLCKLEPRELNSIFSKSSSRKLKRPQSGYFLYLNDNRKTISDMINNERKEEWLKSNSLDSIMDNETPWEMVGKDKVTLVTKKAGVRWKENITEEEKKPYLDRALILKAEYDLKKQNLGPIDHSEVVTEKRGRGRPKGSKNKNKKDNELTATTSKKSSPSPSPVPDEVEETVTVKKLTVNDTLYLLDEKSGDVYDSITQDIIGKFLNGTVVLN